MDRADRLETSLSSKNLFFFLVCFVIFGLVFFSDSDWCSVSKLCSADDPPEIAGSFA